MSMLQSFCRCFAASERIWRCGVWVVNRSLGKSMSTRENFRVIRIGKLVLKGRLRWNPSHAWIPSIPPRFLLYPAFEFLVAAAHCDGAWEVWDKSLWLKAWKACCAFCRLFVCLCRLIFATDIRKKLRQSILEELSSASRISNNGGEGGIRTFSLTLIKSKT